MLAATAIHDNPAVAAQLTSLRQSGISESASQTYTRLEKTLLVAFIPAATRFTRRRSLPFSATEMYRPDQVERWLTSLARHLAWQADYIENHRAPRGMSQVDIVPHLLWPIGGHRLPRFLHGFITASLLTAFLIVMQVWEGNVHHWLWMFSHEQRETATQQALAVTVFCCCFAWITFPATLTWPMPISLTKFDYISHRRRSALVVVLALIAVMLGSSNLLVGLGSVLIMTLWLLSMAMIGGRGWDITGDLPTPHRAVHRDLALGLAFGLGVWLTFGSFLLMLADGRESEFMVRLLLASVFVSVSVGGLVAGFPFAKRGGSGARYAIGLACAGLRGRLPWRFAAFCRWACDAGLLRVAGAAYQFRHRELQRWLLRPDSPPLRSRDEPTAHHASPRAII